MISPVAVVYNPEESGGHIVSEAKVTRRLLRPLGLPGALLALALILAWSGGSSAQARPPAPTRGEQGKPHLLGPGGAATSNPPANPRVVLYDQYDNPGQTGTSSQVFGPNVDYLDDQAADDFVVPDGQVWTVDLVEVDGSYDDFGGPADSVNVFFYLDDFSLPAEPVVTQTDLLYTPGPTKGSFVVPIEPVTLPAGAYWLSVQANQDYLEDQQWYWTNRTVPSNYPAAWRNPLDGFGTGCVAWGYRFECSGDDTEPDQVFRLSGSLTLYTPTPTVTGTPPTATRTPSPTPTLCGQGNYAITPTTGATIVPGTTDTGNHCIDCTTIVNLPFAFQLYDQVFNRARVDSNGTLQFLGNYTTFTPECLPDLRYNFTIFPQWDDLDTGDTSCPGDCGIFTSISGSAPNRVFNIEWRVAYNSGSGYANFEVRLREGQTRFDLVYGTVDEAGAYAVVGVQRDAGSRYTEYECLDGGTLVPGLELTFVLPPCVPTSPTPTPNVTNTPTRARTGTPGASTTPTPTGARRTPTRTATPCPINFSDVQPTDYFYLAVRHLYCAGVISGYADGTFRPFNNTTRGQLSKIVVLALGWQVNCPATGHFSDVPPENPFYCYVETAYGHGIISGYSDGTFRPGNNVTRGQLSKITVLAMGWQLQCPLPGHFSDVPPEDPFFCYIETAYAHNIIAGYSDGTFRPGNNATRGQICVIVYRAIVP